MSGGAGIEYGEAGPVTSPGPVGNWALPAWIHRISAAAWLFIALAVVDLVVSVVSHVHPAGSVLETLLSVDLVMIFAGAALPILLPAAVLWRIHRPAASLSDPLLAGTIATAASVGLTTLGYLIATATQPETGLPTSSPLDVGIRISAVLLGIAGPALMARAILALEPAEPRTWASWAGLALAVLTIAYVAYSVWRAVALLPATGASGSDDPLFVDFSRTQALYAVLGGIYILGQSYLAWVVITATGEQAQPRRAWLAAAVGLVLVEALFATSLAISFVPTALPDLFGPGSQTFATIVNTIQGWRPTVSIVAWTLVVAGFALGLGRSTGSEEPATPVEVGSTPG